MWRQVSFGTLAPTWRCPVPAHPSLHSHRRRAPRRRGRRHTRRRARRPGPERRERQRPRRERQRQRQRQWSATATTTSAYKGVVTADTLALRSAPNRGSQIIRFAHRGDAVSIFCKTGGETVQGNPLWYLLTDGTWAWGAARYIDTIGPAPRWC
ncbi:SH3 domain-containing protein [Streptomyces sp. A244]|uniref:SH3 domain-containing protein n=1 Tax=Streptomyces sp. A244 TaxID=2137016 RepID=UPI0035C20CFA